MTAGEVIPLQINASNPVDAEPASSSDLLSSPGMLAFFLLFLTGSFVFVRRVKPMRFKFRPKASEATRKSFQAFPPHVA